jgi:hypothetical protein
MMRTKGSVEIITSILKIYSKNIGLKFLQNFLPDHWWKIVRFPVGPLASVFTIYTQEWGTGLIPNFIAPFQNNK